MASGSTNQNSRLRVARRSRTKNNKNSRQVLPNDIISEILSLLPAKSICRFKSCSRFFSELTEDKYFLKQQSDNSLLKDDFCFFITCPYSPESKLKLHALHKQNASSSCGVHTRFLEFLGLTNAKITASSNGLLFCRIYSKLFICNPTTLSCSYVPSPICTERFMHEYVNPQYVFECDSEEFKLFAFDDTYDGSFECSIYDPKKGMWKVRKELFFVGHLNIEFKSPVYHKGIIHVLSQWNWRPYQNDDLVPYIATYDVESGMSRTLSVPNESPGIVMDPTKPDVIARLFKWGKRGSSDESICLVTLEPIFWMQTLKNRCLFKIWVLSDYEANHWSRPKQVNLVELGLGKDDLYVSDYIVMNGECLVFATKTTVYKYDLVGEREGRLEEVCGHELKWSLRFIPYSSTLRSCAKPLDKCNIGYEEESEYNFGCDSDYCGRHAFKKY